MSRRCSGHPVVSSFLQLLPSALAGAGHEHSGDKASLVPLVPAGCGHPGDKERRWGNAPSWDTELWADEATLGFSRLSQGVRVWFLGRLL